MVSDDSSFEVSRHFRILGVCWMLYGILRIVTAVLLLYFDGTATLMFGALLNRVADPFTLMEAFHVIYGTLVVFSAVCGVLGIVTGWSLLSSQRSGRMLAIISGFCSLWSIPLGTTLGIYTLIVMLGFPPRPTPEPVPSNLKRHPTPTY